jgi:hypothetical protein
MSRFTLTYCLPSALPPCDGEAGGGEPRHGAGSCAIHFSDEERNRNFVDQYNGVATALPGVPGALEASAAPEFNVSDNAEMQWWGLTSERGYAVIAF